ncbi:MAG: PAS domain S-box protein [Phycisphaerae bacterium]|nr:PAS domain S-box protein [Phycisphaerae bacterium]
MPDDQDALERLRSENAALRARLAAVDCEPTPATSPEDWRRLLCDTATEGLWAIDADARTVYANETMARMLGTTVSDLFKSTVFDFADEAGAATARGNIERRRQGVSGAHDFIFVRRDGTRFRASIRTAPIIDATGQYRGSAAFITDVTDVRRAEQELRRQKDEFHLIFDSAPAMIWFKDAENRILRVNQRAADYSGIPVEQLEGRSTYEVFPEFAAQYHRDDLEVIRANAPKLGIVESIVSVNGEVRWIRTDKIPCRNDAGEAIGVVVFAVDITDAKRAEDALATSEKRYRDLVETSHDLIWAVDAEGCWTFLNRTATVRIFGREPEEMLGHHFAELQSPAQRAADMRVFDKILAGESYFEYATIHPHKDGSPVHLSFNAIVRRDAQGNVVGTTGTAEDITERRRAEAERELINAKLLQTQKLESLGVLAGGIAHDFNNLLVGILGNAALALMDLPPESPARAAIKGVRDASQRAAELVRQLLAYSGRGKFVVEELDLPRMIEEMVHLLSAVISKNAVLTIHASERAGGRLPRIEGDATQIRQVLMNLITNASDALGDRAGAITVSTGVIDADAEYLASTYLHDDLAPGTYVYAEVRDTGSGMDAATQARIFEPFYSTKFTGRGLGLSAVLGILRGHQGAIKVESELGRGTTMTILLPAVGEQVDAEASRQLGPSDDRTDSATPIRSQTILVVDDEEMVRDVLKSMLEHARFRIIVAVDGRSAVAQFREHHADIDAVLLDMTMPTMSGLETFEELRRIDPGVRVVLTSGYSEEDATQRFCGRGLFGFVHKPCLPQELIAMVRAAANR